MGDKHESVHDQTADESNEQPAAENGQDSVEESAPTEEAATSNGEAAESEIARLRDALLRTRAEMDNMQKRSQRELEKARRLQGESLMRDLLPVIDGLEQGMENAREEDEKSLEGLTLTHKLLLKALQDHGLEVIDPAGEPFDPQIHEAMSMQPSDEAEPDSVLMVLQKGYRLHDRLLRAARVIVAQAPAESGNDD